MNTIVLDKGWSYVDGTEEKIVSLPVSASADRETVISQLLPDISGRAVLEVDGAKGGADIYICGQCVAAVSERKAFVDISKWMRSNSDIAIAMPPSGAITRDIKLHYSDSSFLVRPYGVFVSTMSADGVGAVLGVRVETENRGEKRRLLLEFEVLNHRGKRVSKKRKFFTFNPGERTVEVPMGMRRALPYPYMYTMSVSVLTTEGERLDGSTTHFGVVRYGEFTPDNKLIGCTLSHSCGITGELSYPESEMRKLSALRDLGYNTVRYIGCPSENAMEVADDLGINVIVDIFDNWAHPRNGSRAHAEFVREYKEITENTVRVLRNHPSLIMYSIGNAVEESYGRAGSERAKEIADTVRALDGTRPVTSALAEFVPLESELSEDSAKAAENVMDEQSLLSLGRQQGLFKSRTSEFAKLLDVYGYAGRLEEYPHTDKPIIGLATRQSDYFAAIYEMTKNPNIIGDIDLCGMDGSGERAKLGDVDVTSLARNAGLYRSVMLGAQPSFILATDNAYASPLDGEPHWNFERKESGIVYVHVFTAGDVVALYLNGELVGRRLAGKINKHIASFEVAYRPGLLEAVVYTKGYESDRCMLETSGAPLRIKMLTGSRSVSIAKDELAFIDVWVMDGEGRIASHSNCELTFEFENCKPVALGNGDGVSDTDKCVATGGHALVVVKAESLNDDAKFVVKASGEGLRIGRLSVKIKE